jgi:hypothetical protein
MKRSLAVALALVAVVMGLRTAEAQQALQCNDFAKLRDDIQQKANAIKAATQRKAERKEVCGLVTRFVATQGTMVKFLEDNKTWCGVPDEAITGAKAEHEQALKFRTVVCTEGPEAKPKAPSLSDAIGTPNVDTSKNTKTGRGTFDTLTGNPLAR